MKERYRATERAVGVAVMQVLAAEPGQTATVRTMMRKIGPYIFRSWYDLTGSATRPNERLWEQRVRNLKSHDKSRGNVLREGLVERVGHGVYRLTDAGRAKVKTISQTIAREHGE